MKAKQKQELKSSYKRTMIYMAIIFPILLLVILGLTAIGVQSQLLRIFIGMVAGGAVCFALEVIYLNRKDKKAEIQKNKPKPFDPFAD